MLEKAKGLFISSSSMSWNSTPKMSKYNRNKKQYEQKPKKTTCRKSLKKKIEKAKRLLKKQFQGYLQTPLKKKKNVCSSKPYGNV